MKARNVLLFAVFCLSHWVAGPKAFGQGTAFTYQGYLLDNGYGTNGIYGMTFTLFGTNSGGSPVAGPLTNAVKVIGGWFTVTVDFGTNFPGDDRWLEIGVQPDGGLQGFTTLAPRQKITAAPYAITANNVNGVLPANQVAGVLDAGQAGSITNHTDVAASILSAGQVLAFNGALWTNTYFSPCNNVPVSLAYVGTNVPVNAALGTHFRLLATNNFMLQNPTGAGDAQRIVFELIQDATGGRSLSFGSAYKFGSDIPVVYLTTNANLRDFITCVCSGTNFYVVGFVKGF